MPALWIAHVTVLNSEAYDNYRKLSGPAVELHGGTIIARGGNYVQLEGREHPRQVIVRFESIEEALACYNSPEYQEAVYFAKGASERDIVIVETSE
ncbi:DUF1330 domain-containing protein [Poseidonocella sp. HB161398]|uniref:DUF1330 domain-containing protein n=1 Tax=Poseidonocella sp. HB161398 TaxID=2320855 RepID=UPI001109D26B|nr:DUF1330 domain-containing protein [Poseidonocella sp. HB161398]